MVQSNEPTVEQKNAIIAAFEGRKFNGYTIDQFGEGTCNALPEMKYHTSWDWLMPVVKKMAETLSMKEGFTVPSNDYEMPAFALFRRPIYTAISTIHNDAYEFIQWLNRQKQINEQ